MDTNPKRMRYAIDRDEISSEDESLDDYEDEVYDSSKVFNNNKESTKFEFQHYQPNQNHRGSGRKPKCFSKNALMARENRLKKKLYVMKLEKEVSSLKVENKNITSVIQSQSRLLIDLKKEVKYLRSVIANSKDIGNLIRNINRSTGMSVSSSVDESLTLKNVCVSKHSVEQKKTTDLWDNDRESSPLINSDVLLNGDMGIDFLKDLDINFNVEDSDPQQMSNSKEIDTLALEEHNYTAVSCGDTSEILGLDDDVGVCLHVSKHKVSLEFCNACSEKARLSWLD